MAIAPGFGSAQPSIAEESTELGWFDEIRVVERSRNHPAQITYPIGIPAPEAPTIFTAVISCTVPS
jgi:hypothetical protein